MIKMDSLKVDELLDIHWRWFKKRAEEKIITIETCKTIYEYNLFSFWKWIFEWDEKCVEKLVKASPKELLFFTDENGLFFKKFKQNFFWLKNCFKTVSDKNIEDLFYESFGYENFEDGNYKINEVWNAYEFTKKMNLDICPYCGRQYIFTIGDIKEKNGRPQIDHYFPKDKYPYLSCSLYNFIPSCPLCNHQKGNKYNVVKKDGSIKWVPYPYIDCFEEVVNGKKIEHVKFKTSFKFKNDNSNNTGQLGYKVKIKDVDGVLGEKLINAKEAFHLEDLYEKHEIELDDLFERYRNYSDPKIDEITKLILSTDDAISGRSQDEREFITKKIVAIYVKRAKNIILGLPLGPGEKQYPLRKFKEDTIAQLDKTRKEMLKEQKREIT
ncbi:hypothetical protein [uncultured Fibrobacter sp.]|uniref:HNH endonuclease n=1 Tax=uncultured Fibrobacter sp. TaxID=261512 RepID=UPI0025EDEBB5|nr:hypothetical protein [uncultured Fibrobacter sp.]